MGLNAWQEYSDTYCTIVELVPVVLQMLHLGNNFLSVNVLEILKRSTFFLGLGFTGVWGNFFTGGVMSNFGDVVLTPVALGTDLI